MLKGQKCKNCGQKSFPIKGQGNWKLSGRFEGKPILKCKKCGAGLVFGTSFSKDISPTHMANLEEQRDAILDLKEERFRSSMSEGKEQRENTNDDFEKAPHNHPGGRKPYILDYEFWRATPMKETGLLWLNLYRY